MRFALDDFDAIDSTAYKPRQIKTFKKSATKHMTAFEHDYNSFIANLRKLKAAAKPVAKPAAKPAVKPIVTSTPTATIIDEQPAVKQETQVTENTILTNEVVEEAVNAFVAEDELASKPKRRGRKSSAAA